jgi:hypothetical protein
LASLASFSASADSFAAASVSCLEMCSNVCVSVIVVVAVFGDAVLVELVLLVVGVGEKVVVVNSLVTGVVVAIVLTVVVVVVAEVWLWLTFCLLVRLPTCLWL